MGVVVGYSAEATGNNALSWLVLKWVLKKSCFKIYPPAEALKPGHLSEFKPNSAEHMLQTTTARVGCSVTCLWNPFPCDKALLWVGPAGEERKMQGKTYSRDTLRKTLTLNFGE